MSREKSGRYPDGSMRPATAFVVVVLLALIVVAGVVWFIRL